MRNGLKRFFMRWCVRALKDTNDVLSVLVTEATFHLTISMGRQRATSKIRRNNYCHGRFGPSLTGKTSSVSLIFTHRKQWNVKNRWVRSSLQSFDFCPCIPRISRMKTIKREVALCYYLFSNSDGSVTWKLCDKIFEFWKMCQTANNACNTLH